MSVEPDWLGGLGAAAPEPTRADFGSDDAWDAFVEARETMTVREALDHAQGRV